MNHLIVVLTFVAFMLVVFLTRRTFMNGITLILTLTLLGIYMNKGIETMTKYWRIIQVYQAIVLASVSLIQFSISLSLTEFRVKKKENFLLKSWNDSPLYTQAIWHYAGFYEFNDPIWRQFFPLVFLFFFSIIVEKYFKTIITMESEKNVLNKVEEEVVQE